MRQAQPPPRGHPLDPDAPDVEGAPRGARHRPAGPAHAGPGPPAGPGQPGELGIAVCPGEARLHTPPWDCAEHLMGPVGRGGKGPGRWVEGEMSGGEGQGNAASFPAGAFPEGPGGRGRPGPNGEWEVGADSMVARHGKCVPCLCQPCVCGGCASALSCLGT